MRVLLFFGVKFFTLIFLVENILLCVKLLKFLSMLFYFLNNCKIFKFFGNKIFEVKNLIYFDCYICGFYYILDLFLNYICKIYFFIILYEFYLYF